MSNEIQVFAPASIGNVGVGFDILGLALDWPGDEVVARKSAQPGLRITQITGDNGKLPLDPERNTAGVAALRLLEHLGTTTGVELEVHKKLPLGSGLGSSAASAVAAAFAVSELLETGLSKHDLLRFACAGEQLASGGFHADNVAPSMLGGVVLIRDNDSLDVHRLPVPPQLHVAVVHPSVQVLTKEARAILRPEVPMRTYVRQTANLAAFVTGLFNADIGLLSRSLRDDVIEPQRAQLIPGFYDVKAAALATEGALGCSISGAGPAMFVLCSSRGAAETAGQAMQEVFAKHQVESRVFVSPVNQEGAKII